MKPIIACALGLAASIVVHARVTRAAQDRPVLKVSVTTVLVDAIVTDRDGKQVTDLRAEDFEILQDGRRQTVSTFGYVSSATEAPTPEAVATVAPQIRKPPSPAPAGPSGASGRMLVIVVDDLTLSPTSMLRTREELTRIVHGQLAPADRMALIRSGGGGLQPFTGDKALLKQRIDGLRVNPRQFERDDYTVTAETERVREWPPLRNPFTDPDTPPGEVDPKLAGSSNEEGRAAADRVSAGVLGTLQSVVAGLRAMPGRKGILLFSDGFTLSGPSGGGVQPMLQQTLHRLIDQATRAHVVIYAINVRPWEMTNSADMDLGGNPFRARIDGATQAGRVDTLRSAAFSQLAEGPAYLAGETGGLFFRNPSDLSLALRRSLDDQRGYYLLGYAPDQSTIDQDRKGRVFHKLEVRARGRSGLSVRSRKGFLGGSDAAALASAAASTLDLRLTGFFAGPDGDHSIVRTLVYVDASALELQRGATGSPAESFLEILTLLVDEQGIVLRRDRQSYRIRERDEAQASGGFVHRLDVPVNAPGSYAIRVAAREVASNRLGWASQFVVVPDLGRRRLTLSGVLLSGSERAREPSSMAAEAVHPAVRRFKTPADLAYTFQVYNARYGKAPRAPALRAQVRLLRDSRMVYTGPIVLVPTNTAEGTPVSAVGSLSLGEQTSPGDYTLTVTVTDTLAPTEHSEATSAIDFTIEP